MLGYEELEDIARLKRLSLVNAEKDYLQELVLFSIYSNAGKELVFKGGTALYKIYKLNRFSEDLDFTLTKKLDIEKLANKIISDLMLLNIKVSIKEIKEYRNEINVRLLLKGPLYKGSKERQCFIPLNISKREQTLEPKKESLISLYKEIPNFDIFIMSEQEILAEKIRAIFTRQKPRDIYDLWFLLIKKNIIPDINLINTKLSIYSLKFDFKEFESRIEKMKGLWQIDLKNLILEELPDFDKVKKEIIEKIEETLSMKEKLQ
ncbi:MAG: nucleotidyl transferase AbiEii/AbiGii toxin family protein [Nanoarchaeota archaeon]|nr:nucleotidyl transferase AbiEii/AbiGii toxin family protein [Nanoarchaeota archaeon]